MTTSIYARPEFREKTIDEIQQVMRDIYATHRISGLILLVVQAVIMSGLVQLYLATCQPDILTLSVLTAASGLLGGWLGWLCLAGYAWSTLFIPT